MVKRDEFPVSERIALQLGGLQAQVQLGEYVEGRGMDKYENVDSYLCSRVRKGGQTARTNMDWAVKIAEAHRMYGSSKSDLIAKVWYLSVVMQVCRHIPSSQKSQDSKQILFFIVCAIFLFYSNRNVF